MSMAAMAEAVMRNHLLGESVTCDDLVIAVPACQWNFWRPFSDEKKRDMLHGCGYHVFQQVNSCS